MRRKVALIGFGEAAAAFVAGWTARPDCLIAYDRKTDQPASAPAKLAEYATAGVAGAPSLDVALADADVVLCLVTADQALAAAAAAAAVPLRPGTLWCDMNSVAPATKCEAAGLIAAAGGRYVDVAVMSPVHPAGAAAPLLVCGADAQAACEALRDIGFTAVRLLPGPVGRASSVKMIRSVMVKGIEALSAECMLAASRADVLEEVIASLDASPPAADWARRADYNLDRMMVHGLRRAAEMEEVVSTLDALGTGSAMSRGTVERQRALGGLGLAPQAGLVAKIAQLAPFAQTADGAGGGRQQAA